MKSFVLQWQNTQQTVLTETLDVTNAFAMKHSFTIKSLDRYPGPGTSVNLFWGPLNDVYMIAIANCSLVRGTRNYFSGLIDLEYLNGNGDASRGFAQPSATFRNGIGPFVSVDAFVVGVPPSLVRLYRTFQAAWNTWSSMDLRADIELRPPKWKNLTFYGGSLLCTQNAMATAFVQRPFSFDDFCSTPAPFIVKMHVKASAFGSLLAPNTDVCAGSAPKCGAIIAAAQYALEHIDFPTQKMIDAASSDVQALNIGIMQFATDSRGAWQLLQYPLLTEEPSWTFFGSILLFDWIEGVREVVSFEGDAATLVLISDAYDPVHYPTSGVDRTLDYATMHVWHLLVACNFAFMVAAAITCRAVVVDNGASHNFLFFNRLIGSVWIGRPFCFVRGLSAMAILSTAPLTLMRESTGSRLASIPRPLWMSILFTGEATWIVYVLQDVCLIIMSPVHPQVSLPVGSLTAWLLFLVIERCTTVAPEGSLDRRCTSQDMDAMVQCTSGELSIGSPHRVALLLAVALVSLLVQGSVDGCYRRCQKPAPATYREAHYLSGLSGALLSNSHEEDTAALCLSGVVTWTFRGQRHRFDIKTWTLLRHKVSANQSPSAALVPVSTTRRSIDQLLAIGAFLYIVTSITASVSYVNMSRVNLANDFNWAGFNSTGTHVFLATWLHLQLALNATLVTSLVALAVNLPQ
ncbi:hypothetical protein ACHHYP_13993, partial [Achlya hypogyna]